MRARCAAAARCLPSRRSLTQSLSVPVPPAHPLAPPAHLLAAAPPGARCGYYCGAGALSRGARCCCWSCFARACLLAEQKTAVAVAYVKRGRGLIKLNGAPIELVRPEGMKYKVLEPVLLLGLPRFAMVDIRVRVSGGGYVAQIYAIRQAIAKGIVAFYQKYVNEAEKKEVKDILLSYDRTLLVADPRRREPKKFGGRSARARFQKSYR